MRRLILPAVAAVLTLTGCGSESADVAAPPATQPPTTDAPTGAPVDPTPVATPDATSPATDTPAPTHEPTAPPTQPTPLPSAAATPPFQAGTRPDTADGQGMPVTLTDIRVGHHDGFDRVVFDLGGSGRAGWTASYVDTARSQGSGDPVEVAGAAIIEVVLTNTGYPDDTGVEAYAGPRRLGGASVVREVAFDSLYEGQTQLFVGVSGELPFRVYALDGRVVLEVASSG